jgi:plasmid stabilization system protein ParE
MKYKVVWKPTAERELTELWLAGLDREAINRAAHQIDRILESHPEDVGESRDMGRRIVFEPPLACTFSIHPSAQLVRVLRVWKMRAKED